METNNEEKGKCPFGKDVQVPKVDFTNPEFIQNPFPVYAYMRETSPIKKVSFGNGQAFWMVTKYEDAIQIFRNPIFVKDIRKVTPQEGKESAMNNSMLFSHHLLNMDPPEHTKMKRLIQKAFTPKLVEKMRPQIQKMANDLIDVKVATADSMDIISEYALPLPISIISELLGIPSKDKELFRRWSNIILNIDSNVSAEERMTLIPSAIQGFTEYLHQILDERRKQPKEDLITALLQAQEEDENLNEQELLSTIFLLFAAGYETSVNLIGNGILLLIENPSQLDKLRQNPTLIHSAIEEMLRKDPPVLLASERYPIEDTEINGTLIPKGELVLICIGSANHDECKFVEPDKFDIERKDNKHLSFGSGIHFCTGASLGKVEAEIAICTLLERFPHFSLAENTVLKFKMNSIMRGLDKLPIVFTTADHSVL
ncbi:cytochrome P450 [Chryseobacterium sp. BIGb0232]|uniref:cytochrome P450 family protein n=1 Tax=Chryseobacterium sp. BIGb0232 TaxID=2940598 RepID=UPI000F48C593|nr:cytochrome P450 [Chryseobacterium sp. BIGb0232]MCS4304856.1 cytochrome P450 [Chryseobacterium sp. BIGb0232]ROS09719.1 cytochrome P450 [Chryseobacterium nakagawai]